jgi:GNAT superfamily N-acetyltransferase
MIRDFRPEDAPAAAALVRALRPAYVTTEETLLHRERAMPPRARKRSWSAIDGDDLVGWATAEFRSFGGPAGIGAIWVGVHEPHRGKGTGSALYDAAEAHLREHGARSLTVEVDGDAGGTRFAEARGFRHVKDELVSALAVAAADSGELDPLAERKAAEGFRLATLRELVGRERDLFDFWGAAGAWSAVGDPENQVTLEDWLRETWRNPLLHFDGSFVVLAEDGRVAALSWLLVDHGRGRAETEWTATLPELRNRGLARLAKLATIRWAAEYGLRELVTGNDRDNLPMLTLNQRLGYRELYVQRQYEREV